MFFKRIKVNNYYINMVDYNHDRTNCICINFCNNVNKEKITGYNLLSRLMVYATKNYPDQKSMVKKNCELYSPDVNISSMRYGNYIITKFIISYINPKYLDSDNEIDILNYFKELVFNPLIIDNHFKEEYFNLCKERYISDLKDDLDDPKYSSNILMLEKMDEGNYTINSRGYLDIASKMTNERLYELYLDMLDNSHIEVMGIGAFDEDKLIDYFTKNFTFKNELILPNFRVIHEKKGKVHEYIKDTNYIQSKLALACKLYDLSEFEYSYVANLYNIILGSGPSSLLMKTIREESSLVYYINSMLGKMDGMLIINSAFNYENKDDIIKGIKNSMIDIINGNFDDELLLRAKNEYVSILNSAFDSPYDIINVILGQLLFNTSSIEERKEKVLSVTKKDIQEVGKKINMDTIFVLRGE